MWCLPDRWARGQLLLCAWNFLPHLKGREGLFTPQLKFLKAPDHHLDALVTHRSTFWVAEMIQQAKGRWDLIPNAITAKATPITSNSV